MKHAAKIQPNDDETDEAHSSKKLNPNHRMKGAQFTTKYISELFDRSALWVASRLGMTDDRLYSVEVYLERVFRNKVSEVQARQHSDESRLFYWIRLNALNEIIYLLKGNPSLIHDRDAAGATPIHTAYLFENFKLAHWLVEHYGQVALLPYSGKVQREVIEDLPDGSYEKYMPYTGETILHMVIVQQNRDEVRWILDFYNDHIHVIRDGLSKLLTSNASGRFFEKEGDFYFGGYPLQFAVCSNDTAIFDLVLSFASAVDLTNGGTVASPVEGEELDRSVLPKKVSKESHFGANVIFMRDNYGNNCLHLCVLHSLDGMYTHVYKTAQSIVKRELKLLYALESSKNSRPGHVLSLYPFDLTSSDEEKNNFTPEPRVVKLPLSLDMGTWLIIESEEKLKERFLLALNKDLHSPITLAASLIVSSSDEVNEQGKELNAKRISMLSFLISQMKIQQWTFGPVRCSLLNLSGIEIRYDRALYAGIPNKSSTILDMIYRSIIQLIFRKSRLANRMLGAIEWLCRSDSDRAVLIPEVQKIIQVKWERFGFPSFLRSMFLHGLVCILLTLVLIFNNSAPSSNPHIGSEYASIILLAALIGAFLYLFLSEIHLIYFHPYSYFHDTGVVKFSRRCRWLKITSFIVYCALKFQLYTRGLSNNYTTNDDSSFNPQDYVGIKICLTICVLFSWMHMYFFLVGFDTTGPYVLTIFRIVSKDVPYFLKFYSIVVIAFACALSMLANQGNYHSFYGFFILLEAVYSLIQITVNTGPTYNSIALDLVPNDLKWLSDLILTAYFCVVVIIFLNILIAMINTTYTLYTDYSEAMLLIEKYNMMRGFEMAMTREELKSHRSTYAIVQQVYRDDDKKLSETFRNEGRYAQHSYFFEIREEMLEWWVKNKALLSDADKSHQEVMTALNKQQETIDRLVSALGATNSAGVWSVQESVVSKKTVFKTKVMSSLFIVDPQCDYHEGGTLAVPGAAADSERIVESDDEYLLRMM